MSGQIGLANNQIEALVEQARAGSHHAYEQLVGHYQDRIYNYVVRMVHEPAEAQDIAQETFVRAYQALPNFRGASSFQTWLYRIASNLAIDAARSRKRKRWNTVSLNEPIENDENSELGRDIPDEWTAGPAEAIESDETRAEVWKAISELSDKLRPVVVLYDLQGQSYQEIADMLGCPLGTVKSRLFNARSQLREKLKDRLPLAAVGTA
jgi:RNA polymerase sigma-70 factor, ECF subfamily